MSRMTLKLSSMRAGKFGVTHLFNRFMGETWARLELINAKSLISMVGAVGATYHLIGNADNT